MTLQPAIYLPHGGGPCFFMEWSPPDEWDALAAWLRGLPASLPAPPKALLVVSAHWEEPVPTVMTGAQPPLLFDYYGFPPHTYELTWPAPGAPELAARVSALLGEAGLGTAGDGQRGFDHGVFVPLLLAFPRAEVPTLQLSLRAGLDPAAHLALGRALAPLRAEGVLLIGSGMSYHNMRGFRSAGALAHSQRFDAWLGEAVAAAPEEREARLARWAQAPSARECHPREEHLLPLMVMAGAAAGDPGTRVFQDQVLGAVVSAFRFGTA
jgi:aromatic ring-opening dioxygenase catalytic subunit (LigB family)